MTVETKDVSHARLPPAVRALVAARAVNALGAFTLAFLPLLLVSSYGASLRTAGLVAAAFGLATIPSRLLGGHLADRWDRRNVIVTGLVGCALAQLLLAGAPQVGTALAGAVLLGLCFEIYEPPSQALVADLTPARQRPAAYAALGAALAGAGVVSGLLAALLGGLGLRWLFVVDAATCLCCAGVIRLRLPAVRPNRERRPRGPSPWRDRRLRVMLTTGSGFAVLYMTMVCGLPLALHAQGARPWWPGVLVAVSAATVIGTVRLRPFATGDAFARMRTGYALVALGLLLAGVVASALPPGWSYVAPVVVWSMGDAILLGEPFAVVAGLAGPDGRAGYLAVFGLGWGVATAVAPALATGLLAGGGATVLWGGCATVAAALACAQSPVRRRVTEP
jgi:predicted MFS family arabinose efflux permease